MDTVGSRIRYWRKRRQGMTQAALAGLAGVDQSFISKVESGRKTVERRSTLVAIATALQATVADLLGEPGDPTDPVKAATAGAVPRIWASLIEIDEGERRTPRRSRQELDAELQHVTDLRTRANFTAMAPLLPDLLLEGAAHDGQALALAGSAAAVWLKHLGHRHLALLAAKVAVSGARAAEVPAQIGAARFEYAMCLPIESAELATRVSDRTLNEMQAGAADRDVRQILGMLHLAAAMTCATERRTDDAFAHLAEAEREAVTLGDPADGMGFHRLSFGPTNVGIWRMSVATELGEYGRAVEIARNVHPGILKAGLRHEAYWTSLGRALARSGKTDRAALVAFMQAERAAPAAFAANSMAKNAVASIVRRTRHRSVGDDLRILARRLGIHLDT